MDCADLLLEFGIWWGKRIWDGLVDGEVVGWREFWEVWETVRFGNLKGFSIKCWILDYLHNMGVWSVGVYC